MYLFVIALLGFLLGLWLMTKVVWGFDLMHRIAARIGEALYGNWPRLEDIRPAPRHDDE